MTTEDYNAWSIAVQIVGAAISAGVGVIVWVYTSETKKLRKATDEQLALARAQAKNERTPFVLPTLRGIDAGSAAQSDEPAFSYYTIKMHNSSDQPAIYASILLKFKLHYYLCDSQIEILRAGEERSATWAARGPLGPRELRQALTEEYKGLPEPLFCALLRRDPDPAIFVVYMNTKGEMFLTGREIMVIEENRVENWAVTMLYPS